MLVVKQITASVSWARKKAERKAAKKSQHGVLPQTIQSLLAPRSFKLSRNKSFSQTEVPSVHQRRAIMYMALQAVKLGPHLEKKGHAECPGLYTIKTKRKYIYIYI